MYKYLLSVLIPLCLVACSLKPILTTKDIVFFENSNQNVTLGYYNVSPENPSGSLLILSYYKNQTDGSIRILERKTKKIIHSEAIKYYDFHNGAKQIWLNETTVAFMVDLETVKILDLTTMKSAKYYGYELGHSSRKDKVIAHSIRGEPSVAWLKYPMQEPEVIVYSEEIKSFLNRSRILHNGKYIHRLYHSETNLDTTQLIFRLDIGRGKNIVNKYIISTSLEKVELSAFAPLPLHFTTDGKDIIGFTKIRPFNTLSKWNTKGQVKDLVPISGNHLAITDDNKFYAYDNWYDSTPVVLSLYSSERNKSITIFKHYEANITWDKRLHVNPAFSNNNKRLYFNYVGNRKSKVGYLEMDLAKDFFIK